MNIQKITTAITQAENLDALHAALVEFSRLVDLGEVEITDLDPATIPAWGADPGYCDGYVSFDETRILYPSDALDHAGWVIDDRTDGAALTDNEIKIAAEMIANSAYEVANSDFDLIIEESISKAFAGDGADVLQKAQDYAADWLADIEATDD